MKKATDSLKRAYERRMQEITEQAGENTKGGVLNPKGEKREDP